MPYIKQEDRARLLTEIPETPGELNYIITKLLLRYITVKGINYQTINDIVGALECCKSEFYRRVVAEYENKKAKENGDVY